MSEKIPYTEIMERMKSDIDYIAEGAYQKGLAVGYKDGYEAGQHEATTLEYQQGLDDAWECARKIAQQWEEETDTEHRVVIDDSIRITLDSMTASEAIAKLREYEQQKPDLIKVGDEVRSNNAISDHNGVVLALSANGNSVKVLENDGGMMWVATNVLTKTGRHFNFLTSLLEAMKEGAE